MNRTNGDDTTYFQTVSSRKAFLVLHSGVHTHIEGNTIFGCLYWMMDRTSLVLPEVSPFFLGKVDVSGICWGDSCGVCLVL